MLPAPKSRNRALWNTQKSFFCSSGYSPKATICLFITRDSLSSFWSSYQWSSRPVLLCLVSSAEHHVCEINRVRRVLAVPSPCCMAVCCLTASRCICSWYYCRQLCCVQLGGTPNNTAVDMVGMSPSRHALSSRGFAARSAIAARVATWQLCIWRNMFSHMFVLCFLKCIVSYLKNARINVVAGEPPALLLMGILPEFWPLP